MSHMQICVSNTAVSLADVHFVTLTSFHAFHSKYFGPTLSSQKPFLHPKQRGTTDPVRCFTVEIETDKKEKQINY